MIVTTSVVILSYRPDDLRDLLGCLRVQTRQPDEVILVDTRYEKPLRSVAEDALGNTDIRLRYHHRPDLGTCRGRNLGIEESSGDLIVFLDDDLLIAPDYLESAGRFFSRPEYHAVAGITMLGPYPGAKPETPGHPWLNRIRHASKCVFMLDTRSPGMVLSTGFRSELPYDTCPVQWLQGGNSVWRSAVIKRYRFKAELEKYPYALGEDIELSSRIGKEHVLYVVRASGVFHKKSPGRRLEPRALGESLVCSHRHIARTRTSDGSVSMAFYWGIAGLVLHGVLTAALRPSRGSLHYLQGLADGIATEGWPLRAASTSSLKVRSDSKNSTEVGE